jgi:hypothetical protein
MARDQADTETSASPHKQTGFTPKTSYREARRVAEQALKPVLSKCKKKEKKEEKKDRGMLWRYADFVLHYTHRDTESNALVAERSSLAYVEGLEKPNGKYTAESTLDRLKEYLPDLRWEENRYTKGLARTLIADGLPSGLEAAYREETRRLREQGSSDRVVFATGKAVTRAFQSKQRKRAKKIREDLADGELHPGTKRVLEYLAGAKGSTVRTFTTIHREGAEPARAFLAEQQNWPQSVLNHNYALLNSLDVVPTPVMGPSSKRRSPRVFSRGESALMFSREVRAVYTKPTCVWLDLASAQLAIVEQQWGVPQLRRYLPSLRGEAPQEVIWESLLRCLGEAGEELASQKIERADDFASAKYVLKRFLYAAIFGAGEKALREIRLDDDEHDLGDKEYTSDESGISWLEAKLAAAIGVRAEPRQLGESLVRHAAVAALLEARDGQRSRILSGGGAKDCFGHWWRCANGGEVNSVMAAVAQAREMELMLPAIDVAESAHERVVIAFWLHDGIALCFRKQDRKEATIERVCSAVDENAWSLGIRTRLERE